MIIYLITNKINGSQYIGLTSRTKEERWAEHCKKTEGCTVLVRAVQKYGKDNFYIDQIDNAKAINELNWKEQYWIQKLNTLSPNGYNLTTGGKFNKASKETCELIGRIHKGKTWSIEQRKQISDTLKYGGLRHSQLGNKYENSSSKFIGISFEKSSKYYRVSFRNDRKLITFNRTPSELEAAIQYNDYCKEYLPHRPLNKIDLLQEEIDFIIKQDYENHKIYKKTKKEKANVI